MTDEGSTRGGGDRGAEPAADGHPPDGSAARAPAPGAGRGPAWVHGATARVSGKGATVTRGVGDWAERQHPASRSGVGVGWYRRYREVDGGFYALILTALFFTTLLPAALVVGGYAKSNPEAAADSVIGRLGLSGATADLVRSVLAGTAQHKLQALLIAVVSVVIFGLGIGRALQLVYARAWGLEARMHPVGDQARYLAWYLAFLGLILLLVMQMAFLPGDAVNLALAPVWLIITLGFFVWTARFLLHHRVSGRDVLPGAILATLGLLVLRLVSSFVLKNWLDWYSTYYGALGVIMAIFFWILIAANILVISATLSPAYAERRRALDAKRRAAARA